MDPRESPGPVDLQSLQSKLRSLLGAEGRHIREAGLKIGLCRAQIAASLAEPYLVAACSTCNVLHLRMWRGVSVLIDLVAGIVEQPSRR